MGMPLTHAPCFSALGAMAFIKRHPDIFLLTFVAAKCQPVTKEKISPSGTSCSELGHIIHRSPDTRTGSNIYCLGESLKQQKKKKENGTTPLNEKRPLTDVTADKGWNN